MEFHPHGGRVGDNLGPLALGEGWQSAGLPPLSLAWHRSAWPHGGWRLLTVVHSGEFAPRKDSMEFELKISRLPTRNSSGRLTVASPALEYLPWAIADPALEYQPWVSYRPRLRDGVPVLELSLYGDNVFAPAARTEATVEERLQDLKPFIERLLKQAGLDKESAFIDPLTGEAVKEEAADGMEDPFADEGEPAKA